MARDDQFVLSGKSTKANDDSDWDQAIIDRALVLCLIKGIIVGHKIIYVHINVYMYVKQATYTLVKANAMNLKAGLVYTIMKLSLVTIYLD